MRYLIMILAVVLSMTTQAQSLRINVYQTDGTNLKNLNQIIKETEANLKEIGIELKIDYKVKSYDFRGYDLSNFWQSAYKFESEKKQNSYDIIFTSIGTGHTRTEGGEKPNVTTFVNINGGSYLFQHELGHGLGFASHLNGDSNYAAPFWYRRCNLNLYVQPYPQSGLPRSCANRTFLGHNSPGNCGVNARYSWNVPYYNNIFKSIFDCELQRWSQYQKENDNQKENSITVPGKNLHQYCPNWLDLIKRFNCE